MKKFIALGITVLLAILFSGCEDPVSTNSSGKKQNANPIIGTWYTEIEASASTEVVVPQARTPHYYNYKKEYNLIFSEPNIFEVTNFYTEITTTDGKLTGLELESLLEDDEVENPVRETGTWSTSNDTLTYSTPSLETTSDPYWINGDTLFIDMGGDTMFYLKR